MTRASDAHAAAVRPGATRETGRAGWIDAIRARTLRLSPATRVATGLVSLMIVLILFVDVFTGMLPDRVEEARRLRASSAAAVVTQLDAALRTGEDPALQAALVKSQQRDLTLVSIAVRSAQGDVLAQVGDHARHWHLRPEQASSLENARMPILANGQPWGELQITFPPASPHGWTQWLHDPLVQGIGLTGLLGFVVFQLYLRRVLRYLDPNLAVPERVRAAFDTLSEGVLVLDPSGTVMLANRAFLDWHPGANHGFIGTAAASMAWLVDSLPQGTRLPWMLAVSEQRPCLGHQLRVSLPGGARREWVMNCSPIGGGTGGVRGCLVSFADVTELHERTEHLRIALEELDASRQELARKNQELTLLASRDPLTGCLNRRALMHEADACVRSARSRGVPVSCIMCDIDHFKSINDQFGHASGDVVIQAAAKSLARGLRVADLLGRYGGEEFCLILPDTPIRRAHEVAERLRADIEAHVGDALRQPARPQVTMSFGVAEWTIDVAGPHELIDLADQALYRSKTNGRNRVTPWQAQPAQDGNPGPTEVAPFVRAPR